MITAACGQARPPGSDARLDTPAEVAESVYEAYQAGACIAQIRAPSQHDPATGRPVTELETWAEMAARIRDKCDILVHFGVAAMQVDHRIEVLEAFRPDLASFLLGHHDIFSRGRSLNSLRSRDDSVRLAQAQLELGIKPEFEVFHLGQLWNLRWVLDRVQVPRPLYMTMFMGWEGGDWSPPTVEELVHRVRELPPATEYTLTCAGDEQVAVQTLSISRGGHVRVGLGDYPYYRPGEYGQNNAQFVTRMVRIAEDLGREAATPGQARAILGIGQQR
jgi:3-keto-5-aminohexanoate cleavage enzyme